MTQLLVFPVLLITLLLGTPVSAADFQKGVDAYNKGDYATALRIWEPLAEQGHPSAQNNLGVMYDKGQGVTKDYETAVKWYRLAAEQGLASAQKNLGVMYYQGQGVIKDYSLAYMWWNIATSQGNEGAIKGRDIVGGKMSPTQLETAQRLASECKKKRYKGCGEERPSQKGYARKSPPPRKSETSLGSGFFISKLGHVITNQHVVSDCRKVTIGDNSKRQVTAGVIETDRRNDLALLRISSMKTTSVETKSLIRKLDNKVVPLASYGLMRSEDVELGEGVIVAGYPYGNMFSDSIKVTKGIVSATRGIGDDSGQFQIDAAVQPGSSGGPIYDDNGNIVGVVVSQLSKLKVAKTIGSLPENVNFGIKASTVRQFLISSGLPTKWSKRSKIISTRKIAKIAKSQTVMVMCHQ
jgi:S1-C subfamily serine protease